MRKKTCLLHQTSQLWRQNAQAMLQHRSHFNEASKVPLSGSCCERCGDKVHSLKTLQKKSATVMCMTSSFSVCSTHFPCSWKFLTPLSFNRKISIDDFVGKSYSVWLLKFIFNSSDIIPFRKSINWYVDFLTVIGLRLTGAKLLEVRDVEISPIWKG